MFFQKTFCACFPAPTRSYSERAPCDYGIDIPPQAYGCMQAHQPWKHTKSSRVRNMIFFFLGQTDICLGACKSGPSNGWREAFSIKCRSRHRKPSWTGRRRTRNKGPRDVERGNTLYSCHLNFSSTKQVGEGMGEEGREQKIVETPHLGAFGQTVEISVYK